MLERSTGVIVAVNQFTNEIWVLQQLCYWMSCIVLKSSVLLTQVFFKIPFCGIPWGCTHVLCGFPTIGSKRNGKGGKQEFLKGKCNQEWWTRWLWCAQQQLAQDDPSCIIPLKSTLTNEQINKVKVRNHISATNIRKAKIISFDSAVPCNKQFAASLLPRFHEQCWRWLPSPWCWRLSLRWLPSDPCSNSEDQMGHSFSSFCSALFAG